MARDRSGSISESSFSERDFYKREFRGRTLAVAAKDLPEPACLAGALEELTSGGGRALVLAPQGSDLSKLVGGRPALAGGPGVEGAVWRAFASGPCVGIFVDPAASFALACQDLALRLGLFKLVWLDPAGGLTHPGGNRASFVDRADLEGLTADSRHPRLDLCRIVAGMLDAGIPALNVCSPEGLADELFTYAGTGTLFTRERYIQVRALGIDDYDAAFDLIQRGVEEGYLVARSREEVERILAHGFGGFVEGHRLAGIIALRVHDQERAGEIVSLYTLTRFLGEGVGGHLVAHVLKSAGERGLQRVFACTTSERVSSFFVRQGFEIVKPEELPPGKWQAYPDGRRARVRCLAHELGL